MNIERSYNDFKMYKLLESILVANLEYRRALHVIPDSKIANKLFDLVGLDIKTNYNSIELSDKNDEIAFIPDNQYQRFISAGEDIKSKTKSKIKVGRMAKQILKDNGFTNFTDSDIEKFVNGFKSVWDRENGQGRVIELVKGEDIKKWYNEETYNSRGGTLGNSCMRHTTKSDYMNIYAYNPDKVSMIILTFHGKLIGRALVWQLDEERNNNKVYLDRIYTEKDSDIGFIYDWFINNHENINVCTYKDGNGRDMKVYLDNVKFEEYPYADTMNYLYSEIGNNYKETGKGFVSNSNSFGSDGLAIFELTETNGDRDARTHRYYEDGDGWVLKSKSIDIYGRGYYPQELCVLCKYKNKWLIKSESVYSEYMDDWVAKDDAIETEEFGIVHKSSLKNCVYKYIGRKNTPIEVFDSIINADGYRVDVINKLFKFKKVVDKSNGAIYNDGAKYISDTLQYITSDISVNDIWEDSHINVLCDTVYKVNENDLSEDILNAFTFQIKESLWMLEAELEAFGFEKGEKIYLPIYQLFNFEKYKYSYKVISDILSSKEYKSDKFESILKNRKMIHETMKNTSVEYRFTISNFNSNNGVNSSKMTNEVSMEIADRLVSENTARLRNSIRDYFRFISGSEDNIDRLVEIFKIYIRFMVASNDSHESKNALSVFITEQNKKNGPYNINDFDSYPSRISSEIYNVYYYDMDNLFYNIESEVMERIGGESGVNRNVVRGYIRSSGIKSIKI